MAAVETLSFDRHLRHAFASLSGRLENGIRSLDGVIEMLRLRIEAEAQFAAALQKIMTNQRLISSLDVAESLRKDGLNAIHADMHNEYTQRIEFLNSLNEDVYQPCVSMREQYAQKNRSFAHTTKGNIKTLRKHQNEFYKIKSKYEKVCKDASNARTALLNAKLDAKISSAQILKLGSKVNSTLKTQQQWREKYGEQQLTWNRQQIKFDDEMTSILQGMQSNEFNRMSTTKDCLNKWAVFITNLCANRNYDVKNLAESMALINIDADLQLFIRNVLNQHPSKNANGITPPHHSFHYGKAQANAASNLNKTSIEKNIQNAHINHKHHNSQSLSLSSFNPSFNTSQRKGSTSYSFSGQQDIYNDLSKRPIRQSTSIGSFIKQKFKKDKDTSSLSNAVSPKLQLNDIHRENSNTISSYHGDSEVYPPIIDDEHDPTSPRSPRSMTMDDPEIFDDGTLSHNGPRTRSMKKIKTKGKKKKKILNKPRRRNRHTQSSKYRQSQTPKAGKPVTPVTPTSPHQIPLPPRLHKSRSHPIIAAPNQQNLNMSSYTANTAAANMQKHHQHNHIQVTQCPNSPITPLSPLHNAITTQSSPHQTAITVNHSAIRMSPNGKIKMNVQPQQIIVFKTKKAQAQQTQPTVPPQIAQSSNDLDEDDYDGLSTPTLSGASDDEDDVAPVIYNNTPVHTKTDTPLPVHHKKKFVHKTRESPYKQSFNDNTILNHAHFFAERNEIQPHQLSLDPLGE
eukprot:74866_1